LFPTALRTSGLSISNALAQMILGGTTPFISLWLIEATGRSDAPAFYMMFAAALSIAAVLTIRREADHARGVAKPRAVLHP
jgi:MHS family proline/betaine transporter-like MFS transporter